MKYYNHLLILLFSLIGLSTFAQTSKKTLNYQAVILDPKAIDIPGASIVGQPLSKGKVCLRFSLLNAQGGLDYEETQQVTTDEYGLVNVAIGSGTQAQSGNSTSVYKSFESVVWNSSVKSLKVSVSYDGCSSFKQVSAQALNYTPYALYAEAVDYKNVREAPTKLSQFSNDPGYLISKDLDPIRSDIKTNSSQIATSIQNIADNKQASDAAFLVVNQSITSLDKQVAQNTGSISTINTKIIDQQNQILDNRNQITATNNNLNTQIGGLQGQLNTTNSTVNSLTGVAEVVSNKSTAINLGGANPSDQAYPSQRATKAYVDNAIYDAVGSGVPDATTLAAGKVQLAGDLSGTAASPTVPALAGKENSSNKTTAIDLGAGNPSDQLYPSQKATKAYVDNSIYAAVGSGVPDATTNAAGKVKLAGDLAGTAASPTVPGLLLKADIVSPTFTGTPLAPTPALADNSNQIATTAFVQNKVNAATVNDATSSAKGILQLAGDLAGSASSPLVAKIQGNLVSSSTPTSGQVLTYDGTSWGPAATSNAAGTLSGTVAIANGGTGATTKTLAFNALSPMTTAGDIIYGGTNGTGTRLGIGANATVLQVANGIPSWASISTGDLKFVYSNNNIGIGTSSTLANATAGDNVAMGRNALGSYYTGGISGGMNIGIGTDAGDYNMAGSRNVYVGASSGITNETGNDNTFIGYNSATSVDRGIRNSISNSTAIGANSVVTTSNKIQLGDGNITNVSTYGTLTAGDVTYPKTHGTANQVLSTSGGGTLTWSSAPSINANLNNQTGTTYTLQSSDNGKVVTLNNVSAITLTVPSGLDAGFNCMIVQKGAGLVTISASGVTVANRIGFTKTAGTNAIATIVSIATNYFITGGDMQ